MKRRATKNQLLFRKLIISHQLRIRIDQHVENYGQRPKVIYLQEKDYDEYVLFMKAISLPWFYDEMKKKHFEFRGIPIKKA